MNFRFGILILKRMHSFVVRDGVREKERQDKEAAPLEIH